MFDAPNASQQNRSGDETWHAREEAAPSAAEPFVRITAELTELDQRWAMRLFHKEERREHIQTRLRQSLTAGEFERLELQFLDDARQVRARMVWDEHGRRSGDSSLAIRRGRYQLRLKLREPQPMPQSGGNRDSELLHGDSRLEVIRTGSRGYFFVRMLDAPQRTDIFAHISELSDSLPVQVGQRLIGNVVRAPRGIQAEQLQQAC